MLAPDGLRALNIQHSSLDKNDKAVPEKKSGKKIKLSHLISSPGR